MGMNISKRKTNTSTRRDFADLPDPILANIFSLLPIQSIVRCRTVCKSWLLSISSTDFDYIYQTRNIFNTNTTFVDNSGSDYYLLDFNANVGMLDCAKPVKPTTPRYILNPPNTKSRMLGCCNGLIFLVSDDYSFFHIWNPVLAEYISVSNPRDAKFGKLWPENYGFGYCPSTGEYKILKVQPYNFLLDVLTIGPDTTTWRSVGKLHFGGYNERINFCYFNGVIHWICECGDDTHLDWITCFNLRTEKHFSLCPPHGSRRRHSLLTVVKNCLCLVNYLNDGTVLWLMKDYGVAESWTKSVYHNPPSITDVWYAQPLALRGIINILLVGWDGTVFYYDFYNNRYVNIKTTMRKIPSYIPSFVPLLEVFKKIPSKIKKPKQLNDRVRFLRSGRVLEQLQG